MTSIGPLNSISASLTDSLRSIDVDARLLGYNATGFVIGAVLNAVAPVGFRNALATCWAHDGVRWTLVASARAGLRRSSAQSFSAWRANLRLAVGNSADFTNAIGAVFSLISFSNLIGHVTLNARTLRLWHALRSAPVKRRIANARVGIDRSRHQHALTNAATARRDYFDFILWFNCRFSN